MGDTVANLPTELYEQIIAHVQDRADLALLARSSRPVHLLATTQLYRRVIFTCVTSVQAVEAFLETVQHSFSLAQGVVHLEVDWMDRNSVSSDDFWMPMIGYTPVTVPGVEIDLSSAVSRMINLEHLSVGKAVRNRIAPQLLKDGDTTPMPTGLKALHIYSQFIDITDHGLQQMIRKQTTLSELSLGKLSLSMVDVLRNMVSLHMLRIVIPDSPFGQENNPRVPTSVDGSLLKFIRRLDLCAVNTLRQPQQRNDLFALFPNLQQLNIFCHPGLLSVSDFSTVFIPFPTKLERVGIMFCPDLMSRWSTLYYTDALNFIQTAFPDLDRLDILCDCQNIYHENIGNVAIQAVAQHIIVLVAPGMKRLRWVTMAGRMWERDPTSRTFEPFSSRTMKETEVGDLSSIPFHQLM